MRTTIRTAVLLALPIVLFAGRDASVSTSVRIRPGIVVRGGSPDQVAMVRWAVGRYELAGLRLPPLVIWFHADARPCGGLMGLYGGGHVEMCTGPGVNAIPRMTMLHELGHAWSERAVTGPRQARFLRLRGAATWDSPIVPWGERGWEQAAEIMAWGLGDRLVKPRIPYHDPEDLQAAYELVTGSRLPPG
jgi:hypothetical protein